MDNNLHINSVVTFLKTVRQIVRNTRNDWVYSDYGVNNYVLEKIRDIGSEAMAQMPSSCYSDSDGDAYHSLWLGYIEKFKEIEFMLTPSRMKSLYTMFDDNLWSGTVEDFEQCVSESAEEFCELKLAFTNQEGDVVECPHFEPDCFVRDYPQHVDNIWLSHGRTNRIDMNAVWEETGESPLQSVVISYTAKETIGRFLHMLDDDIASLQAQV